MVSSERVTSEQGTALDCVQQNSLSFSLPEEMTIETAEALAAELKQLSLAEKTSLVLDASQVENITTPGLQLIIALEKSLTAQGSALVIKGKRDSFADAFKDAGLESLLSKSSQ
jgi:anti-anti-sigma factor